MLPSLLKVGLGGGGGAVTAGELVGAGMIIGKDGG